MICFLASRLDDPRTGELSRANGLADELRKCLPVPCRRWISVPIRTAGRKWTFMLP